MLGIIVDCMLEVMLDNIVEGFCEAIFDCMLFCIILADIFCWAMVGGVWDLTGHDWKLCSLVLM